MIDYIIGLVLLIFAIYILYRIFKKNIQKGKCANCSLYSSCQKSYKS
ncbi:FeoB-associated Cys-rich membrane protein [Venenivibrio stagnispumantis]|nr:FeoB-associated Cys-rich membrane protein [Venenivibrio stagnispumantis]MCW4573755.1 FeoB-associated Cys-rich membrane protein [Venenivibrio stagnispumantis]